MHMTEGIKVYRVEGAGTKASKKLYYRVKCAEKVANKLNEGVFESGGFKAVVAEYQLVPTGSGY